MSTSAPAHSFTHVVLGAGTAGSVLAARLAEDPDARVLVVEAGPLDRHLNIHLPPGFVKLFRTRLDWNLWTEPEPGCDDRRLYWPRGRVVGGSGSLNAQLYVRGHRRDYDRWRDHFGCPGWGWDDVLPLFRRSEGQARGADPFHGADGPWRVEDRSYVCPMTRVALEAAAEMGLPLRDDFNTGDQDGFGLYQVNQKGGRRWSTARAFLHPALERPNLELWTGTRCLRLRVEHGRVTGVDLMRSRRLGSARRVTVRVDGEVILCAGAVHSPHLLLVSGIGPADALRGHGVPVVHDLPAVGRGLQDHLVVSTVFRTRHADTLDSEETFANLVRWLLWKRGPLTTTVCEGGGFVTTGAGHGERLGQPDLQMHFIPAGIVDHGFDQATDRGFNFGPTLIKPRSRGRIGLASADPLAAPRIEPRYLSEPGDLEVLVRGVELARELAATRTLRNALDVECWPGPAATRRADLEAFVRRRAATVYHPAGSCAMGPDPATAVVDPALRVHGLDGLRVADASIMPDVVGGNTNAPSAMIAEKAADLLRS